ncbi:sigma-54-dependent Fis family transcriptional regulator [Rubrivivax gelatinosus]|uniref:Sigma-54-dependent Fis family transcriptional regulator n=1 Tax=Rubrivivax gelatinosus TaxID=28068 RepID=A0ABS1E038_RUBGE|nr:sigma-54-dependent Fis family transcriptional regulator [Rubrivivax gelatinosus]MBK1714815.1 sigma-54-dependent Fis family transcriptional regulator [Rubrivivax gelatinosus]
MANSLLAARTPPARLREARRRFLDTGDVGDDDVAPALTRSWRRSRDFGLAPVGRFSGAPHASAAQLARALEQQQEFVAHARPVMEFLFDQTRDTDNMVILADAQGMLLHALGDADFVDRAQRVALRPGASWHEQWRGTNAIGTALAEGAPVVVHGSEHYLERNAFLTCTAAPIADPAGRLLGVLDISGDQRGYHRHTLALVRSAARIIEHRLFDTRHAAGLRLRLHAQREGLGTVTEGLLALSEDGWVIGANGVARAMLALTPGSIGRSTLERVLPLDLQTLAGWSRSPDAVHELRREDGSVLWLRVEGGRGVPAPRPPVAPPPAVDDALAPLDTGDAAMQAAIGRARRVLDKPIALLLQGESGVGKELFARAVHKSGARRDAPFVAVNCAALPENLIEAELFGYRPGAFTGAAREGAPGRIREAHGGTLFLDEIGDMPTALQTRLLRVLQEREVTPLGGGRPQAVDFRLICATHHDLRAAIEAGRFREDLYYRLNGLALQLPPLRRRSDQPALVAGMLQELLPGRAVRLASDVALAFGRHRWPGNLRQLHNALATACALLDDDEHEIGWAHLSDDLAEDLRERPPAREAADDAVDLRSQSERTVRQVLQACAGNLSEAARRLGISRNTLYRKMRELRLR